MKNKIKVAITGGIGSGKSTVAEYLSNMGYSVFSCDTIYKEIYPTDAFQQKLRAAFPSCVKNGLLDKKLLTAAVFSDDAARKTLNALTHPCILSRLYEKMDCVNSPIVFAEVPLLFETGLEDAFDFVIVVMRDIEQRIHAIIERDGGTSNDARKRIQAQWDYDSPQNRLHLQEKKFFILYNQADRDQLKNGVNEILYSISNETIIVKH